MIVYEIDETTDNILDAIDAEVLKGVVTDEQLIMIIYDGLHFLIPFEITANVTSELEQRERFDPETTRNKMPDVTLTLDQLIPIPDKTAELLMAALK